MAIGPVYVLHGVQLPSSVYLGQVTDGGVVSEADVQASYSAGHVTPLFRCLMGSSPSIDFTTSQLATLLAAVGQYGADLSAGNVDLLYRKVTNFGTRSALNATDGYRFRASEAMAVIRSLSAQHRGLASAQVGIIPVYDGSNAPIVPAGSVAMSGTPSASELYTLGPVVINGTQIDGCQGWNLDFGINVVQEGDDGNIYNTHAHVEQVDPSISFESLEVDDLWSYGFTGTNLTSFAVYLRKKSRTGNVADGTSQHIKISGTLGQVVPENTRGGGNRRADSGAKLFITSADSSTDPLTITVASAIP